MAKLSPTGHGAFAEDSHSDKSSPYALSAAEKNDTTAIQHDNITAQRNASTTTRKANVAALLRNPLAGMTENETIADVDEFIMSKGLQDYRDFVSQRRTTRASKSAP